MKFSEMSTSWGQKNIFAHFYLRPKTSVWDFLNVKNIFTLKVRKKSFQLFINFEIYYENFTLIYLLSFFLCFHVNKIQNLFIECYKHALNFFMLIYERSWLLFWSVNIGRVIKYAQAIINGTHGTLTNYYDLCEISKWHH